MKRLVAPLLLSASAALCLAAPPLEEWRIERREWTRDSSGVAAVEVINPWGDVRVRGGKPGEIYLLTVAQRHEQDPRELELLFRETPAGLAIETRFPAEAPAGATADWELRRVDLTVYLPKELPATIRTTRGLAEVKGLESELEVETGRGDVALRAAGRVRARSEHGSIQVQFSDAAWPAPSELDTVTGAISVELPDGAAARVELETRGDITTDFSLNIERAAGSQLKRGTALIGAGGQTLRLRSYSGALAIRRSPARPTP